MPIELRSWINPQSYSNSYSTAPIAREAGPTSRLRVVVAHRPGTQAPTASARAVATLDRVSAGRTGLHLILGSAGGSDLPRDGDLLDRAGRYRRAAENLQIFTGVLTRDEPFDFDGEFYQVRGAFSGVKPAQSPRPAISLPAESPEAVELAARHADVLAFHGASRAKAAAKIAEAKAAAAAAGPRSSGSPSPCSSASPTGPPAGICATWSSRSGGCRSSGPASPAPASGPSARTGSPTSTRPRCGRTTSSTSGSPGSRGQPRPWSGRRARSPTWCSPTTISASASSPSAAT